MTSLAEVAAQLDAAIAALPHGHIAQAQDALDEALMLAGSALAGTSDPEAQQAIEQGQQLDEQLRICSRLVVSIREGLQNYLERT